MKELEPENISICDVTGENHVWKYDEEQDAYRCEECNVLEFQQED